MDGRSKPLPQLGASWVVALLRCVPARAAGSEAGSQWSRCPLLPTTHTKGRGMKEDEEVVKGKWSGPLLPEAAVVEGKCPPSPKPTCASICWMYFSTSPVMDVMLLMKVLVLSCER
jgi:hypothetical protein